MTLLLDVFGYLDVLLRGIANVAQALTVGGTFFLLLVVHQRAAAPADDGLAARIRWGIAWSAASLAAIEAIVLAVKVLVLTDTIGISPAAALGAGFVLAGALRVAAALAILALVLRRATVLAAVLAIALVAVGMIKNHAVARLDDRAALMAMAALHQLAAAAWIGGIPFFIAALAPPQSDWLTLARRFSAVCAVAVAVLLVAGLGKSWLYIAEPAAVWGTSYGVMTATKVALFCILLVLGGLNFLALRRGGAAPDARSRVRLRAEVELAVGLAVFFAAASLTSLPPAVDLPDDRATLAEIAERWTPQWPRFSSPSHAGLELQLIRSRLEAEPGANGNAAPRAYVPGAGEPSPRNAVDIAWSEYNHHWAGLFVLVIGLLALVERSGRAPWARSWPLLFIGLAAFLFVRSDPNAWPLGDIGFFESLRDADTLQHRTFMLLIVAFGLFEWGIRTGRIASRRAASIFPVGAMVGGIILLSHSHALANVKQELLVELTHLPIALLGLAAGVARWHELRSREPQRWLPALIWPMCFIAVGLVLLIYREA